jgi:V/A-type H+-transporting ATPase subunit I
MAILKMKRIRVIGESKEKTSLLAALMKFGCVELSELALPEEQTAGIEPDKPSVDNLQKLHDNFNVAHALLKKYAREEKAPLFKIPEKVSEQEILSTGLLEEAAKKAMEISALGDEAEAIAAEIARLELRRLSLLPWKQADVAFDTASGAYFNIMFGTCPIGASIEALRERLTAEAPECWLEIVSSDREQHYLFVICHRSAVEEAGLVLRDFAFSRLETKDLRGTAAGNIKELEAAVAAAVKKQDEIFEKINELGSSKGIIEQAIDATGILTERETMRDRLLVTQSAFYAEGWIPERYSKKVVAYLEQNGYAYDLQDPSEDELVPICYKNNRLVEPYEMLINLYGVPQYEGGLGIDAAAATAPFFAIFFGMMLSDAAYGLLLLALSLYVILKIKPSRGSFLQRVFSIGIACGISTLFWGALFGGWFGNAMGVISKTFFGREINLAPIWFDPLAEPMTLLVLGFALGLIHIFVGMGLSALRSIKQGNPLDALFDVGFWYIVIISLILALLGVPYALYGAAVGAIGIVLTAGRGSPSLFGKLTGGLGSLYGISGYLSDVLSYSRLLALGLATGVVATVINTMGVLGGNTVLGAIVFTVVFIVGHAFNLAINLLGAYVHSSRLQYVEFFNKFFVSGGKIFSPMRYRSKYVEIIKEEM